MSFAKTVKESLKAGSLAETLARAQMNQMIGRCLAEPIRIDFAAQSVLSVM